MAANFSRNILFSVIIFLIGFQNVAIANQNINLSLIPSKAYADETTTFTIEFTSAQNLSNAVIHFYVDGERKGAKYLFKVEKNKKDFITFDYFFNKNSYFGEHYIELKTDFIAENQESGSESFYATVDVDKRPAISESYLMYFLLSFVFISLIGIFIHSKYYSKTSAIKFDPDDRKILFSFMVTVLPISISIFTLYFTEKPELKIGMLSILLSFIISFTLAIYLFIKAEKKGEVPANNVTIYSLYFLFIGLLEMLLLVLIF